MRKVTYYKDSEMKQPFEVEYDENAPCIICGEPVINASMGGTVICPSCDLGKCRYCKMDVFVMKQSLDGGKSKKSLINHMKWHRIHTPEIVKETNDNARKANELFDKLR